MSAPFKNKTAISDNMVVMNRSYAFLIFCAGLCLGAWVSVRSWDGTLFVYVGEPRSPAAVRSLVEYSTLSHDALTRSAQAQLMSNAVIYKDSGMLGVQLGHPLIYGANGAKQFGCQVQDLSGVYDHMQLIFVGTGVTSAGEPPRMIVNARCRSEHDLNQLETVWIPMQNIMTSKPTDQEFDFPGENLIHLKLESIPDQWPENWVLWSVSFYRDDASNEQMILDSEKMRQVSDKLLSFDWKAE